MRALAHMAVSSLVREVATSAVAPMWIAFLLPAESRVVRRSARSLPIARSYSVEEMATSTRCAAVELMQSLS